ncbi:SMC-Scp complex subunit ScpB [Melittangium boletus]|uniref:SMC-Scp complex subunit ScpB n=1 Tax=Melittangium boletus DSM 14713 TaxID=1294270 RepID=A0A250IRZ1_9BACT|nr:SMC-Scp complex subunit ScpB [Melittangium boletus]ATB33957.1 SMC-Scp complex subunit ScpB [Melittangium boletus DSM 14713]
MSTGNPGPGDGGEENEDTPRRGSGGPSPFTEEEIAAVTGPGEPDELEDSETATIEADEVPDLHTSFEKLVQKSRHLSPERIRTVVESVLFVADKPLDLDQLYEATGIEREKIQEALNQISGIHRDGISGMVLYEVSGGWQFRTDPHSAEYVRRYLRVKPQRLTRAAVETLAIIAYRQPVTRPEVEDIRGVDCGAVIKALLDRKLIKILGKKEEVGRPMLYGTSREFLEFFALKDLSALPTLREFHELTQEHQEIVEKERPAVPGASGTVEALADPEFQKRMDKSVAASEAALEELEEAMNAADMTQRAAASLLNPTPPPTEGEPGSEPG